MAVAMIFALSGCATYSASVYQVESSAANRDLDKAVKSLDALNLDGADETLHHLNKGTLLRLQGNYAESNKHLEAAKVLMGKFNAISIKEQAASVVINDTFKAYEGLPGEQMMVYAFEALNYLQSGELDDAAVEARQFDVAQHLISEKYSKAKYLSGAFVRYLNGMVYEAIGERDEARIEMQKAVEGYRAAKGLATPRALIDDAERLAAGRPAKNEVVFILHNGLGPTLSEQVLRLPNPNPQNGSTILSLAVPKLVLRQVPVARVVLTSGKSNANSEEVEDVNALAEKSLDDRLPVIVARGIARLVAKNVAVKAAKQKAGDLFGFVADIASIVSERADTRSWSLLPGNVLMARLVLPAGKHDLKVTYYSSSGGIIGTQEYKDVIVNKGRKSFVSDYYMNPPSPSNSK